MIDEDLIIIARNFKSIVTEGNPLGQSKMEHASMVLLWGLLPQRNKCFGLLFSGKYGYFQILKQQKALSEEGSPKLRRKKYEGSLSTKNLTGKY